VAECDDYDDVTDGKPQVFGAVGPSLADVRDAFVASEDDDVIRISFKNIRFEHYTREILMNIIAHNAAFDRRFAGKFCETFTTKAWGCSMAQVDWAGEGFQGTKLAYLATQCGFFYDAHRAAGDCAGRA
jgi:DNA polymerase III epsilon subunit-like protein